ncbi:MAG: hypothetical protein DRG30_06680 [Epsilonproteobacteria bacterium]|nr:MAG: hypothetical protein DRG30_06680 [Campylobacterota bacterium]
MINSKKYDVLSLGTSYLDINFVDFPFVDGISANRETVGSEYVIQPGGSALNFARLSASLGMRVAFIGKVGVGQMGEILTRLMLEEGIDPFLVKDASVLTNLAVHYIRNDGTSIMTSGGSANQNLSVNELMNDVETLIPQTKYLYLGGGFKMKHLLSHYKKFITLADKSSTKIILDHGRVTNLVIPKEIDLIRSIVGSVDIYLPSKDELLSVWNSNNVVEAVRKIRKQSNATIIVKDSDNGSYFSTPDLNLIYQVSAHSVDVINTVGAGDAFNAGLVNALVAKKNIEEVVKFATATSALKISVDKKINLKIVNTFQKNNPKIQISELAST